jgi:5-methylcytosine-specific restriction endonuclease McrA
VSDTLLLSTSFEPVSILPLSLISWQHAIKLVFLEKVTILETYPDWIIRSERLAMPVPAVCITAEYFNIKKHVKFCRQNMYLRDLYQCQYCGDTFPSHDLTIDHVIPRCEGGRLNWGNAVTSCRECNSKKGRKKIKPMRTPYQPDYYNLVSRWREFNRNRRDMKHPSWAAYLQIGEFAPD